jgi:hypothetical protein
MRFAAYVLMYLGVAAASAIADNEERPRSFIGLR